MRDALARIVHRSIQESIRGSIQKSIQKSVLDAPGRDVRDAGQGMDKDMGEDMFSDMSLQSLGRLARAKRGIVWKALFGAEDEGLHQGAASYASSDASSDASSQASSQVFSPSVETKGARVRVVRQILRQAARRGIDLRTLSDKERLAFVTAEVDTLFQSTSGMSLAEALEHHARLVRWIAAALGKTAETAGLEKAGPEKPEPEKAGGDKMVFDEAEADKGGAREVVAEEIGAETTGAEETGDKGVDAEDDEAGKTAGETAGAEDSAPKSAVAPDGAAEASVVEEAVAEEAVAEEAVAEEVVAEEVVAEEAVAKEAVAEEAVPGKAVLEDDAPLEEALGEEAKTRKTGKTGKTGKIGKAGKTGGAVATARGRAKVGKDDGKDIGKDIGENVEDDAMTEAASAPKKSRARESRAKESRAKKSRSRTSTKTSFKTAQGRAAAGTRRATSASASSSSAKSASATSAASGKKKAGARSKAGSGTKAARTKTRTGTGLGDTAGGKAKDLSGAQLDAMPDLLSEAGQAAQDALFESELTGHGFSDTPGGLFAKEDTSFVVEDLEQAETFGESDTSGRERAKGGEALQKTEAEASLPGSSRTGTQAGKADKTDKTDKTGKAGKVGKVGKVGKAGTKGGSRGKSGKKLLAWQQVAALRERLYLLDGRAMKGGLREKLWLDFATNLYANREKPWYLVEALERERKRNEASRKIANGETWQATANDSPDKGPAAATEQNADARGNSGGAEGGQQEGFEKGCGEGLDDGLEAELDADLEAATVEDGAGRPKDTLEDELEDNLDRVPPVARVGAISGRKRCLCVFAGSLVFALAGAFAVTPYGDAFFRSTFWGTAPVTSPVASTQNTPNGALDRTVNRTMQGVSGQAARLGESTVSGVTDEKRKERMMDRMDGLVGKDGLAGKDGRDVLDILNELNRQAEKAAEKTNSLGNRVGTDDVPDMGMAAVPSGVWDEEGLTEEELAKVKALGLDLGLDLELKPGLDHDECPGTGVKDGRNADMDPADMAPADTVAADTVPADKAPAPMAKDDLAKGLGEAPSGEEKASSEKASSKATSSQGDPSRGTSQDASLPSFAASTTRANDTASGRHSGMETDRETDRTGNQETAGSKAAGSKEAGSKADVSLDRETPAKGPGKTDKAAKKETKKDVKKDAKKETKKDAKKDAKAAKDGTRKTRAGKEEAATSEHVSRGPDAAGPNAAALSGWRVRGLARERALLVDREGRPWSVGAGDRTEDFRVLEVDFAKRRVRTDRGILLFSEKVLEQKLAGE